MPDLLPDCRTREQTGARPGPGGVMWVPVYCAHCHSPGGLVPAENMNFVFYLCNQCFADCGEITNTMVMPDEVFWEKLKQEQLEQHGRFLSEPEISEVIAADASPLATLIKDRR